ncbi:HK97-gp10 family putative phage morphogenesis protein [Streptococcus sp. 263_SSPC]|uniref:HK97-gp10 family putative phage morphogenesis protein n=1 Tax=Streptococcus sp. 263_SSPC TaxID=1579343 RepID=UPI00069F5D91|nr:HK97-gp10 family putative phage morphogenesis protein [Streptococcus sp. 263_SSPC]
MGSLQFELKGLEKLQAKLQKVAKMEEVERIVEKHGSEMQKKAVINASKFRGHYEGRGKNKRFVKPTGATKRSISVNSSKIDRFKYRVAPGTAYAAYVELGTRKMSAQPFIKPAFDDQKKLFKDDLERLVK